METRKEITEMKCLYQVIAQLPERVKKGICLMNESAVLIRSEVKDKDGNGDDGRKAM